MYCYVQFYKIDNEWYEIYSPLRLGGFKEAIAHSKNSDNTNFNNNENINTS